MVNKILRASIGQINAILPKMIKRAKKITGIESVKFQHIITTSRFITKECQGDELILYADPRGDENICEAYQKGIARVSDFSLKGKRLYRAQVEIIEQIKESAERSGDESFKMLAQALKPVSVMRIWSWQGFWEFIGGFVLKSLLWILGAYMIFFFSIIIASAFGIPSLAYLGFIPGVWMTISLIKSRIV